MIIGRTYWTTCLLSCILLGSAALVFAQPREPVFGPAGPRGSETSEPRPFQMERRFFESKNWTFFHAIRDLPPDMKLLLRRVAGSNVVGPGEPLDLTDVERFPNRVQHSYTAVTEDLGVIVWYSSGPFIIVHAALYDRKVGDACVYDFGRAKSPVFPLESRLSAGIQFYGAQKGGCSYLSPKALAKDDQR